VPVKVVHMPLVSDVVCARKLLRSHFPKKGAASTRRLPLLFDGQVDQYLFANNLTESFQWFVCIDEAVLNRCMNLPDWMWEIRSSLRQIDTDEMSIPEQQFWGRFLSSPWLVDRRIWDQWGAPKEADFIKRAGEEYWTAQFWTVDLTLNAFDEDWLSELLALASEPPVEPKQAELPLLESGDGWVRIRGGEQIQVPDPRGLVLLQVLYEQWQAKKGATKKSTLCKLVKAQLDCALSTRTVTRVVDAMPAQLRKLISQKQGTGYQFIPPSISSGPKSS
jgi:hypothetical protein